MKYLLIVSLALLLGACGDTVSQSASGGGSNQISTGSSNANIGQPKVDKDGKAVGGTGTVGVTGADGYLPGHCPVEVAPVESLIGCSAESYKECHCYDPQNPAQSG